MIIRETRAFLNSITEDLAEAMQSTEFPVVSTAKRKSRILLRNLPLIWQEPKAKIVFPGFCKPYVSKGTTVREDQLNLQPTLLYYSGTEDANMRNKLLINELHSYSHIELRKRSIFNPQIWYFNHKTTTHIYF